MDRVGFQDQTKSKVMGPEYESRCEIPEKGKIHSLAVPWFNASKHFHADDAT